MSLLSGSGANVELSIPTGVPFDIVGWCLQWVDQALSGQAGAPIAGGSAAAASKTAASTPGGTIDQAHTKTGDVALFDSGSGSAAGHAGICANDGCTAILSDLKSGVVNLTNTNYLSSAIVGSRPVFVPVSQFGSGVASNAQGIVSKLTTGLGDLVTQVGTWIPGLSQTTTGTDATTTPAPDTPTTGQPAQTSGGSCTEFSALGSWANPVNVISYLLCVLKAPLLRVAAFVAGLILLILGVIVLSRENDTVRRTQDNAVKAAVA